MRRLLGWVLVGLLGCSSGGGAGADAVGVDGGEDASNGAGHALDGFGDGTEALGAGEPRSDSGGPMEAGGDDAAVDANPADSGAPSVDTGTDAAPDTSGPGGCADPDHDGKCSESDPCPDDSFDDRDGDGVCDSADPCPNDRVDDSDSDGVCASADHCAGPGAEDGDGDRACDGEDACEGFDDREDADDDGTPDGCDVCPIGSDADGDHDGVADLCDQVLWRASTATSSGAPYESLSVVFDAYQQPELTTLLHSLSITVPLGGDFDAHREDIGELVEALRGSTNRRLVVSVHVNGAGVSPIGTYPSPIAGRPAETAWTRITIHGFADAERRDFAIDLRGYEP